MVHTENSPTGADKMVQWVNPLLAKTDDEFDPQGGKKELTPRSSLFTHTQHGQGAINKYMNKQRNK